MRIVVFGLSITSSWGNGHATTYRALTKALARRGHEVVFLERDVPWYADNRDLPSPPFADTRLYASLEEAKARFGDLVARADLAIVGSYVPKGAELGRWVIETAGGATAFYDIDTPVTLDGLAAAGSGGGLDYLTPELVPAYDLYLSFTGGPILETLRQSYGARRPRALYCAVDPELYYPDDAPVAWDLGYLGTYAPDRQDKLDALMLEPARRLPQMRFAVFGPMYPPEIVWPGNVERADHLAPDRHRSFYTRQRFTLNVTRAAMTRSGWAPPVRIFEAAACGTPLITDAWPGVEALFEPGEELLVAGSAEEAIAALRGLPEERRREIGAAGRARVLDAHTGAHRAQALEAWVGEVWAEDGGRTATAPKEVSHA